MTTFNVQFADSTEQTVTAYFSSPQDAATYENLGTLDSSDVRWKTYYASLSGMLQIGLPAPTT
jgi:hypothetical protein